MKGTFARLASKFPYVPPMVSHFVNFVSQSIDSSVHFFFHLSVAFVSRKPVGVASHIFKFTPCDAAAAASQPPTGLVSNTCTTPYPPLTSEKPRSHIFRMASLKETCAYGQPPLGWYLSHTFFFCFTRLNSRKIFPGVFKQTIFSVQSSGLDLD